MNILITGTSSGIGNGLAKEFLKRDANVWGISRRNPEDLFKEKKYNHLTLDLKDATNVYQLVPEFIKGVKQFDLIVLNSGILGEIKWMSEISVEKMKEVFEINVWANKVLLDILFAHIKKINQVIGMSSKASLRSTPGWGPYSLSKAGLNMLMNIYAKEHLDTHFTAFAPGLVDSEIQETIYNIKEIEKYPTIKTLQDARYTDTMPDSIIAAPMLISGIEKALEFESGSFVDVRDI